MSKLLLYSFLLNSDLFLYLKRNDCDDNDFNIFNKQNFVIFRDNLISTSILNINLNISMKCEKISLKSKLKGIVYSTIRLSTFYYIYQILKTNKSMS